MKLRTLLPFIALCAAGPALAADNTGLFYAGGSIGGTMHDLSDTEDALDAAVAVALATPGSAGASADVNGFALQLGAQFGYQFNRFIAAEVFYKDLGSGDGRFNALNGANIQEQELEYSARGLGIGLLGFIPIGQTFNLMLRVDGINLRSHVEQTAVDTAIPSFVGTSATDTQFTLGYGAGFQLNFDTCTSLRVEASFVEAEVPGFAGQSDWGVTGLSVGMMKSF